MQSEASHGAAEHYSFNKHRGPLTRRLLMRQVHIDNIDPRQSRRGLSTLHVKVVVPSDVITARQQGKAGSFHWMVSGNAVSRSNVAVSTQTNAGPHPTCITSMMHPQKELKVNCN